MGPSPGQAPGGGAGILTSLLPFILMFAVLYFLLIRPQQKRQRQHQEMLASLKTGDKVVTQGGLIGTITGVKPDIVVLRLADNVKIEVQRSAISQILVKKTEKTEKTE